MEVIINSSACVAAMIGSRCASTLALPPTTSRARFCAPSARAGADRGRELRAIAARAEQENWRQCDVGWHGLHTAERMAFGKAALLESQQLLKAVEEIVGLRIVLAAAQRVRGHRIGAGRAARPGIGAGRAK